MYWLNVIDWMYVCYKIWKINKKSGILPPSLLNILQYVFILTAQKHDNSSLELHLVSKRSLFTVDLLNYLLYQIIWVQSRGPAPLQQTKRALYVNMLVNFIFVPLKTTPGRPEVVTMTSRDSGVSLQHIEQCLAQRCKTDCSWRRFKWYGNDLR